MTQSEKKSICIILGSAHGASTAGKQSPDGSLKEFQWSRMMCTKVQKQLQEEGYRVVIDSLDNEEIGLPNRVQIVNNYCGYFGKGNTLYFSIHCNASPPVDNQWHKATGWQCHIAKNASEKSKRIATLLYEEIEKQDIKVRRPKKDQNWWANDYYVLKYTKCAAVLCETMFQDNKQDVEFLLSKKGQDKIQEAYCNAIKKYVNEMIVK